MPKLKVCPECKTEWDAKLCHACTVVHNAKILSGMPTDVQLSISREWMAGMIPHLVNMLEGAENYSETKVYRKKPFADKIEITLQPRHFEQGYVLTIQRLGKLSPHDARKKAEEALKKAEEKIAKLQKKLETMKGKT